VNSPIRIIEAVPGDAPRLTGLFDGYRRFYGRPTESEAAGRFLRRRLERGESVIFVADLAGSPAGFAQIYPSFDSIELDKVLILHDLFVEPGARRCGVARALMEAVRQYGETVGACGISLATAIDNDRAQALYEQLGYQRDERFLHYFLALSGGGRDEQ
jgi:ribosomal protein S18 acetylase RimI-like enzyme